MSNKILIGTWRARCSALVAIVVRESSFVNLSRPLFNFHVVYHGVPHGESRVVSRVVSRGPMSATWMFEGESGQQHNKAEHVGHDDRNMLF